MKGIEDQGFMCGVWGVVKMQLRIKGRAVRGTGIKVHS